jgi:hypothetical protein
MFPQVNMVQLFNNLVINPDPNIQPPHIVRMLEQKQANKGRHRDHGHHVQKDPIVIAQTFQQNRPQNGQRNYRQNRQKEQCSVDPVEPRQWVHWSSFGQTEIS